MIILDDVIIRDEDNTKSSATETDEIFETFVENATAFLEDENYTNYMLTSHFAPKYREWTLTIELSDSDSIIYNLKHGTTKHFITIAWDYIYG